jgi:hypothetical protein
VTGHSPWIIFDSWTSLLKSEASGDKISDVAPIFRQIRSYRDSGATCTIIDHTGKKRRKEPIGTSAKMTQMDSAHAFHEEVHETDLFNSDSYRAVIRVETFLKRYAPPGIGTFSFEVRSAKDKKGGWHLTSLEAVKDKAVRELEYQTEEVEKLINDPPSEGVEDLVKLAGKIRYERHRISERDGRKLLKEGTGKHWKSIARGPQKRLFRVLKPPKL